MSMASEKKTLPKGFKAAGISAHIKKSGKPDLALFYSQSPCVASGMFTSNSIKAAPLEVSKIHLEAGPIRAVIVNSGNANCMTGERGFRDARAMTSLVARELSLKKEEVLVSSTGIIGKPLPLERIAKAIPLLSNRLSYSGLYDSAKAIMTTDTFPKVVTKKFKIGNKRIILSGVAKGAGMIAPKMRACLPARLAAKPRAGRHATMLAFLFTDASIEKSALKGALSQAVEGSFNAITIDGCMSTNDTVIALANGSANNELIKAGSKQALVFEEALKEACLELAKMIVEDAEGATKFIEIVVKGAASYPEARDLAFSVANSNLFKCAMFGNDPNWGRIAAALGSVPSRLKWEKMDIYLNKRAVFKSGRLISLKDNKFIKSRNIRVVVDLHSGNAQDTVYTSDLSYGYVRINAEYN